MIIMNLLVSGQIYTVKAPKMIFLIKDWMKIKNIPYMAGPPKPRIIYVLRTEFEEGFTLIIKNIDDFRKAIIRGMMIEPKGTNHKHVIFEAQGSVDVLILKEQVIAKFKVDLIEDEGKYWIKAQDYNEII